MAKREKNFDVSALSVADLLKNYGMLLDELRQRKIVRSANNPLSDYAELLFCIAFGWRQLNSSSAGCDAVDDQNKISYQIKARRLTAFNTSRQLSAIRNLNSTPFDYLAGLLVDKDFQVLRAAIIPFTVVQERCVRSRHTNSWKFLLLDEVWRVPGVRDVTPELKIAAQALERASQ